MAMALAVVGVDPEEDVMGVIANKDDDEDVKKSKLLAPVRCQCKKCKEARVQGDDADVDAERDSAAAAAGVVPMETGDAEGGGGGEAGAAAAAGATAGVEAAAAAEEEEAAVATAHAKEQRRLASDAQKQQKSAANSAVRDTLERKHHGWLAAHHGVHAINVGFPKAGQPSLPGSCLALIADLDPARAALHGEASAPAHVVVLQVLLELLDAKAAAAAVAEVVAGGGGSEGDGASPDANT